MIRRTFNLLFVVTTIFIGTVLFTSCNSAQSTAVCGNNGTEGNETCDGVDLNGENCESLGFGQGTLQCNNNCREFNTILCSASATCGDNIKDGSDICDGDDLNGRSCETQGFGPGTLACQPNCAGFDTSACGASNNCGDGNINAGEMCDGNNLNGRNCVNEGFEAGDLACSDDCRSFDTADCYTPCTPDCGSRVCGPDPICGESCGGCTGDWEMCSNAGQCEKYCDLEPLNEDRVLNINLETVQISGEITLNGATMPDNTKQYNEQNNRGDLTFTNIESGDTYSVAITATGKAVYSLKLFKGSYNITLRPNSDRDQNVIPYIHTVLANSLVLESTLTKNYNLETVQISGEITLNGATMPDNTKQYNEQNNRGDLIFQNIESGDTYLVAITSSGKAVYSLKLFKGSYNITLRPNSDRDQNVIPYIYTVLAKSLVLESTLTKNYNLETVQISGEITLNGATMPDNTKQYNEQNNRGDLTFTNIESGDTYSVAITATGKAVYSLKLFKGSYNITLRPNSDRDQNVIPYIHTVLAKSLVLESTLTKNYNLETVQISGEITLNGATMPDNTKQYSEGDERGSLTFTNIESGDTYSVAITATGKAVYSLKLFKGSYNISLRPNSDRDQNVLPYLNINLMDGCLDFSQNCEMDRDNITGVWEFIPRSGYFVKSLICDFAQDGNKITGTYNASGNITEGSRNGNHIHFEFTSSVGMTISVDGEVVSGCAILGTFDTIGYSGSGFDSEYIAIKFE